MTSLEHALYGHEVHGPVLGQLVLYSVHGARLPHAEGKALYEALSMKDVAAPLPPVPKDIDTFATVCSDNSRLDLASTWASRTVTYLIRPITPNVRGVVREVKDLQGETLALDQVGELRFQDGKVSAVWWDNDDGSALTTQIITQYERWRGCLNSYKLREWLRSSLLMHQATAVRDGLYFLMQSETPALAQIEQFARKVPGRMIVRTLPLIDDENQRAMVEEAFTDEAIGSLEQLLTEVGTLVNSKTEITARRFDALRGRYQDVASKIEVYTKVLDRHLMGSGLRIEMLEDALLDLGALVKQPKGT
jgi:uncharacterized protein DUF6744